MPENPHDKEDLKPETEKLSEEKENPDEKSTRDNAQTPRSYYYDDACGYEIYTDDEGDESEDQTNLPTA
jgi:hypothetical protein